MSRAADIIRRSSQQALARPSQSPQQNFTPAPQPSKLSKIGTFLKDFGKREFVDPLKNFVSLAGQAGTASQANREFEARSSWSNYLITKAKSTEDPSKRASLLRQAFENNKLSDEILNFAKRTTLQDVGTVGRAFAVPLSVAPILPQAKAVSFGARLLQQGLLTGVETGVFTGATSTLERLEQGKPIGQAAREGSQAIIPGLAGGFALGVGSTVAGRAFANLLAKRRQASKVVTRAAQEGQEAATRASKARTPAPTKSRVFSHEDFTEVFAPKQRNLTFKTTQRGAGVSVPVTVRRTAKILNKDIQELVQLRKNLDPDGIFTGNVLEELNAAVETGAGKRIFIEGTEEVIGQKSGFASATPWVPDSLRSTKLYNQVLQDFTDGTIPRSGSRRGDLYEIVQNEINKRLEIDKPFSLQGIKPIKPGTRKLRDGTTLTVDKQGNITSQRVVGKLKGSDVVSEGRVEFGNVPPQARALANELTETGVKGRHVAGTIDTNQVRPSDFDLQNISPNVLKRKKAAIRAGKPVEPIVVDREGNLLDGHHTFVAARELGKKKLPVVATIKDLPRPKSATSSTLTSKTTGEITDATKKLIKQDPTSEVITNKKVRVFKRISNELRNGALQVDDIPALKGSGVTQFEAAQLFDEAASESGKILNKLSQVWSQIQKIDPVAAKRIATKADIPPTAWDRIQIFGKNFVNIWRSSLVSQLATAVRNFETFGQRYFMNIVDDAMTGTVLSVTGKKPVANAFAPMMEDLLGIFQAFKPGAKKELVGLIDEIDPLLTGKLYNTPVTDIAITNKYANFVNTFNRVQEYFARTMTANARIAGELKLRGIKPKGPADIPADVVASAVDDALNFTYAATPKLSVANQWIKLWNDVPVLPILTYPFPRYFTNAIRNIYEFSPLAFTKMLHPKYQKILMSGNPTAALRVINKASIGTGLFVAGNYIRNSEWAGDKWYEIKIPEDADVPAAIRKIGLKPGSTVDTRAFGPLLPVYLFIGEALRDPSNLEPRDWAEGVLGINRMAGTTLFMVSMLSGQSPDSVKKALKGFTQEFLGGFTIPARTFSDFLAMADPEEAIIRDTREEHVLARAQANIPVLSQSLPAKPSITRGTPIQREETGLRQLTGLTVKNKTFLESEMDRLDVPFFDVIPKTGDANTNRAITRGAGKTMDLLGTVMRGEMEPREALAELEAEAGGVFAQDVSDAFFAAGAYGEQTDNQQQQFIRKSFSKIKREVKSRIMKQSANDIAGKLLGEMQNMDLEKQREHLRRRQNSGLITKPVIRALAEQGYNPVQQ